MGSTGHFKNKLQPIAQVVISLVVLIILLSAGSQLYFTQERVFEVLKSQLLGTSHEEDANIQFKKAQMSFSGSLNPFFAVKITDIHLTFSGCKNKIELKSPYVLVPLFLSDAFNKKINMGYIKSGDLTVHVFPPEKKCETSNEMQTSLSEQPSEETYNRIFQKVEGLFKRVRGLRVQSAHVHFLENGMSKDGIFKRVRMSFDHENGQLFARADVLLPSLGDSDSVKSKKVFGRSSKNIFKVSIDMSKDRGLLFSGKSRFSKGTLKMESEPQKKLNDLQIKFAARDIPLDVYKQFVTTLMLLGQMDSQGVRVHAEGHLYLRNFFKKEESVINVRFKKVDLFGASIKIYAQDLFAQVFSKWKILEPFDWQMESMDIDKVFPHLSAGPLKKMAKDSGVLSGTGLTESLEDIEFEGLLTDFTLKSLSSGTEKEHNFSRSNLDFNFKNNRLSIFLNGVPIDKKVLENLSKSSCTPLQDSESQSLASTKGISWKLSINQKNYCL